MRRSNTAYERAMKESPPMTARAGTNRAIADGRAARRGTGHCAPNSTTSWIAEFASRTPRWQPPNAPPLPTNTLRQCGPTRAATASDGGPTVPSDGPALRTEWRLEHKCSRCRLPDLCDRIAVLRCRHASQAQHKTTAAGVLSELHRPARSNGAVDPGGGHSVAGQPDH
jgi:hypothetical protein